MSKLRRLVLVRHGETEGNSSVRYCGVTDVALSDEGRNQIREARRRLGRQVIDLVVASPLRRSWEAAQILFGDAPIVLDRDFREVDFGRWEGLTAEEIRARDPILYEDWQAHVPGFEYPEGETRQHFRDRISRGLQRIAERGVTNALIVAHKGVIRAVAEELLGEPLVEGAPELGGIVSVTRNPDGSWQLCRPGGDSRGGAS